MSRNASQIVTLALSLIHSGAFTLPMTTSIHRASTIKSPSAPRAPSMKMSVCGMDNAVLEDRDTLANKKHLGYHISADEINEDSFEKWTLQLFDDSSNTRTYVCRCLVEVAGLSEEDSYRKMMEAHRHGDAVIGEYCQEYAEHYKEALRSSGLVCEIFPVEN
mmetsp:Transcript_32041/g.67810  ORF Transcript_32041/g.67810 Transcript_32041/m.67810 type:complete len:162 (-) Transcript_32041:17-502(-)